MSKMVYLPYVRFEQEEGEGRGWHGGLSLLGCRCLILRRWNTGN